MYQKIIFVGNLGRDPESRYLEDGRAMATFSLAVNFFADKAKHVMWVRVMTFEKTAEQCTQYLHKGSSVLVEGRLIADTVTGGPKVYAKKDGTMGASFEMVASSVTFLSTKKEDEGAEKVKDDGGVPEEEFPVF